MRIAGPRRKDAAPCWLDGARAHWPPDRAYALQASGAWARRWNISSNPRVAAEPNPVEPAIQAIPDTSLQVKGYLLPVMKRPDVRRTNRVGRRLTEHVRPVPRCPCRGAGRSRDRWSPVAHER
jgi:hypothetical protein